jgi:hypothetical protein
MIERACDGENAFDGIVVHSFSRYFRDAFGLEFYVRKLAKHGVRLVSITQELVDDPAQVMDATGDRAARRIPVELERQTRPAIIEPKVF